MRILIHTNQMLYPGDGGGKIRSAHLFEALARRHDVTVAVFRRPCDDAGAAERMRRCAARVIAIDWDEPIPPSPRFWLGAARATASPLPFSALKMRHAGMRRAIAGAIAERRPDLVVCDFVQNAVNLPLGTIPAVLSAHNVEATIIERLAAHERNPLARGYLALEAAKLRRYEAATARRFDRVAVVSDADRAWFETRYRVVADVVANGVDLDAFRLPAKGVDPPPSDAARATNSIDLDAFRLPGNGIGATASGIECTARGIDATASDVDRNANGIDATASDATASDVGRTSNGIDLDAFRLPATGTGGRDVVFVGCLDWSANADAATYYVEQILPHLRRRAPSRFWIVGRNPPPAIRALAERNPDVTVTGTVPDVRPYLARAAVVVVPLRIGGGTRIKILEALAMQRAVVSTTVGAEGLALDDGRHLLRADQPGRFAEQVARLLASPGLRDQLGAAGRRRVEERYSWAAAAQRFVEVCEEAVSPRLGAARGTGQR